MTPPNLLHVVKHYMNVDALHVTRWIKIALGQNIEVYTDAGPVRFPIIGIAKLCATSKLFGPTKRLMPGFKAQLILHRAHQWAFA